jgi:hypothetical protein
LFNIELENITAIEVSLLLELGYVIEESTEPKKKGNKVVEVSTFTISWEDGNSFGKLS